MSNSPLCPTGYGVVTKNICMRLANEPYNQSVAVSAYYGQEGHVITVDKVRIYHRMWNQFGDDAARMVITIEKPDIFVSLFDVWVGVKWLPELHKTWIGYCPIDHDPIPDMVYKPMKQCKYPLAMSKFGLEKMKEVGLDAYYIPHGTETDIFKPQDNKIELRKKWFENAKPKMDITDDFIIGINAANKGNRKSFDRMMEGYRMFLDNNPDAEKDSKLYLNTWMVIPEGLDLHAMVKKYKLDKQVLRVNDYRRYVGMSTKELVDWYNMLDLFLNTSMGEGFGIPIIEAESCGIPCVVTDFSAMPELVKGHGWVVEPQAYYTTALLSKQALVNTSRVADAIEEAYTKDSLRKDYGKKSREFALGYDYDKVILPMWDRLLKQIMEDKEKLGFMKPNVVLKNK